MLVWKAMPSITPMMSTMRPDEAWIWPMVCTTCPTACPPAVARSDVACTNCLAWRALSAFCRTVLVK